MKNERVEGGLAFVRVAWYGIGWFVLFTSRRLSLCAETCPSLGGVGVVVGGGVVSVSLLLLLMLLLIFGCCY